MGSLIFGRQELLVWTFCVLIGIVKSNFINFKPGYEYEYKLETSSTVKNIGEFYLKAKLGYINVGTQTKGQEIFLRIQAFSFSQAATPHTVGHGVDFTKWFSFIINRYGEIRKVFYDRKEEGEIVAIKKGMAALFAARLHHKDEKAMEKTPTGWKYHVQEFGHEGPHNATYHVEHHSKGQTFTKTRLIHPLANAKSNYTKTMFYNRELENIHSVHVDENVSAMKQTVPGYDPYEGQRPTKPDSDFAHIEYPEMSVLGKGKLEFQHQHKIASKPDRKYLDIITDSIHVKHMKRKPIRSHTPQLILQEIRSNLTIMRNQPEKKATQITLGSFNNLMKCIELLDDDHFYNLTNHYLSLKPISNRNEKDRNNILDAVTGTWTERAQDVVTEKVLNSPRPDVHLIMRLMVHIITMDTVPIRKLLKRLLELGLEPHKSPKILRQGHAYHRILLTIGSVSRKLHQSGRTNEAFESVRKIEKLLAYHDPYIFRQKRSIMTEEQIEVEDTFKVNLLGALGNARLERSYEHIVSHINSSNCQWVKRAGITALRGYHHSHAAELLLNTAKYDEDETVRYEALLQYQRHPHARQLTPLYHNSSDNGSYFNPWDLNSPDMDSHSRKRRQFVLLDDGFQFKLQSPSLDYQKIIGSKEIGASFGILIKNLLDLKIAAFSGHAIVDVHDEAYARVHLGVIGMNLDFFLARLCFKGSAEYNLNLLKEFGINTIHDLVNIYDRMRQKIVNPIIDAINLFKDIIQGKITLKQIVAELKQALEKLPVKVVGLGHNLMEKLGEINAQDFRPFQSVRKLVTRLVTFYNDIKKDVMGFYNKLFEAVTIIIPRAAKSLFTCVEAIIDAFRHFMDDPKTAIMAIGGNVLNIRLEVKNFIDAIRTIKNAWTTKKPYWFDLNKFFDEFRESAKKVRKELKTEGKRWTGQSMAKGNDPVATLTKGKFTKAQLKQHVIDELQTLLKDSVNPFHIIKNLGGDFFKRVTGVFKMLDRIKKTYNLLKEGYRRARSAIDRMFGPKCSSEFPRKIRTPGGGCSGSGTYPSELKTGKEYTVDGVDLLHARGTKLVAPFPGYIRRSQTNKNEVIIRVKGGSLKDTDIIITNIIPNSNIEEDDTDNMIQANQIIGEVIASVCGVEDHIHFAMRKSDGGVIDPTMYLELRFFKIPMWKQECNDIRFTWKLDVIADRRAIEDKGKKTRVDTPKRRGGKFKSVLNPSKLSNPANAVDKGVWGEDTMYGKAKSQGFKNDVQIGFTGVPKIKGFENLFTKIGKFLKQFSIRNLKIGAILDLLNKFELHESKQGLVQVILKIKEIIDDKPCFNPYQMTDDQLRAELVERGQIPTGSRHNMIKVLTAPDKKCAPMSLNMPKTIYCTYDQYCLGVECCVHLKVFMFLKTYKVYARFDPCELEFIFGIKGIFEKRYGGFKDYGGLQQQVKPGVKIGLLGGMELIFRVKVEKTKLVVLASLGIGFCSVEDPETCMPFLNLMDDTIIPLPICHLDETYTFTKVDWKEYYNRDAVKQQLKESAKKQAEESIQSGIEEVANIVGLPEEFLEETPLCPRPEILTQTKLTERLNKRGLSTTGSVAELRSRLIEAEKECELLGKTFTLPTIKNEKLNRMVYMYISPNCMELQACINIQIKTKFFNFTKALNSYVQLDTCNFLLHIGFEGFKYPIILVGYKWGTVEEIPFGEKIKLRFRIDKDIDRKVFIIDLGLAIKFSEGEFVINGDLLQNMQIPIPICNKNFILPGGGTIKEFAKALGGKLTKAAVDLIFQKLGIEKVFTDGVCQFKPLTTDCPWTNDVNKYLPVNLKDTVSCGLPEDCFGLNCCMNFEFKIPFVDEPIKKSSLVFANFDPCSFQLTLGFGDFIHTEKFISYQWGTPLILTIGNGELAPITLTFVMNKYVDGFIIDLNVLACVPIDGTMFCFPEEGLDLMKDVRIPACNAKALVNLTNSDFDLDDYFKDTGQQAATTLVKSGAQFLMDKLGITPLLLEKRCDAKREPYSSNVDGWNNNCPKPIKKLPKLPKGLVCHIGESCTKIECCFDVKFLDMSFYALFNLDMCDYYLEAAIESENIKHSLFDNKYDLDTGITGNVQISSFFQLKFTARKANKKFLIDLDIKVCFKKDKCQESITVLRGAEIPQLICDLNAKIDINSNKFSLNAFKIREQLPPTAQLTDILISKVLEETELADYLLDPGCNRQFDLYINANSKHWIKDCPLDLAIPTLPDSARCHWSSDCSTIDCCIFVGLIQKNVHVRVSIDVCNLQMTLSLGKLEYVISMFGYRWGVEDIFHIGGRVRLYYTLVNLPEQQKIKTDIVVRVCFEDDSCIIDQPLLQQVEVPYSPCSITKPVPFKGISFDFWKFKSCQLKHSSSGCSSISLPSHVSNICRVNSNCLGVTCCVSFNMKYLGTYSLASSFNLDHCGNKLTYSLESKMWEKSLETVPKDRNVTEAIGEAMDISYFIHDAGTSYVVTLNLRLCVFNTYKHQEHCKYLTILDQKSFLKPGCNGGRKRRSANKIVPQDDFETGLKELLARDASSQEIGDFINEVKDREEVAIADNLSPDWKDGGQVNSVRSALKTMGSLNPSTILYKHEKVTVSIEGSEEMFKILNSAAGIADRAKQAFIVGKGLTEAGVKLLGAKLSNMTIGELMTIIYTKNIDPEKAIELVKELRNLASALYSNIMQAVRAGKGRNVFQSLDSTMEGGFSFPQQSTLFFEFSKAFLIVVVPVEFKFGAGCFYGMNIRMGAKLMKMAVIGGVEPYGGLSTYGELKIGFLIYVGLRLEGYILTTSFPTVAEIGFAKFPLDISATMDLELVPLILKLKAVVTLRIANLFKITLYRGSLWEYSTPSIRTRLIDFGKKDKDESPPSFFQYTDKQSGRRKRAVGLPINTPTRQCSVRQLPDRDHTESAIEISTRSEDDKSQVRLFLTAGTKPGLSDALSEIQLGGPSSVITAKLQHDGVPIYFTLTGKNSGDGAATVTCSIPTYDTSLPGGRFTAEFLSSSNTRVLKASVVVFEDTDLVHSAVGVGIGRGIYGDEIVNWTLLKLRNKENVHYDDIHGHVAETHFTSPKKGRLNAPKAQVYYGVKFFQACLKKCLELPKSKCLSVNYDYGEGEHCELLESIEGHDHSIAMSGKYVHMERLGVGMVDEFYYPDKRLEHNKLYYFNLDLKNAFGYRRIISTKGVLIDITPPVPGEGLMNATSDLNEKIPCQSVISFDRVDYNSRCIDQSDTVLNHRIIIDGPGSNTVFNGHTPLSDLRYTRANGFLSANWEGIHDKETGVLVYSFTAGTKPCEESASLHPHHDPHKHFYDESEWTHVGFIKKTPPIPDGQYYVTVRALNKVEYGGPLATTFCHSVPYIIDNTVPFVHEVFNVRYDEESKNLSAEYNAIDPESDVKEVDICLGKTPRDCYIRQWMTYPHSGEVIHNTDLPGGIPIWVKIKAWNNVNISALRSADHPLVIDITPPIAGEVYDGPHFKHDLQYTKDGNKMCANWLDFYDPESGMAYFSVFVRASENNAYLTNGTDFDYRTHQACIDLDNNSLQHNKKYYIELWAFNAGHRQLNVSGRSDGVVIDLTLPVQGKIIDGRIPNFKDVDFNTATSVISSQWKGQSDPESDIKNFEVQILRAQNNSADFEVIRDWRMLDSDKRYIEQRNFYLKHQDHVKTKLKTTNGALAYIIEESDGYIVDLTPPRLVHLNDGDQYNKDIDYQSLSTGINANFKFVDEESGVDYYRYQIYQKYQGSKHQIYPETDGDWEDITNSSAESLSVRSLLLINGGRYSVRISAVNKANAVATFDTNGVKLDNTPPEMRWVHVGVFNGELEDDIDGFVIQADKSGIKATWFAADEVSGIQDYYISVGTGPGVQDILPWKSFGTDRDGYIDNLILQIKTETTPYYYVSVKAMNGAGLESTAIVSTPVKVVDEDKAGVVIDGADRTKLVGKTGIDIDYQRETGSVTVQFTGFQSAQHGITQFDWAIGTSAGGEEVQPFIEAGLIHKERTDVPGNGIASDGFGQAIVGSLEPGILHYITVRGITNAGNVLQSTSDGFTVDITPPSISIESLSEITDKDKLKESMKIFQSEADSISADWIAQDRESNISGMWYAVGSYPNGIDIKPPTPVSVYLSGEGSLPVEDVKPSTHGKSNIVNFWAVNNVGITGKTRSASLIVDTSSPTEGTVTCPTFIQPHSSLKCTWNGFVDAESPILEFTFGLGTQEGLTDVLQHFKLPGYTSSHLVSDLARNVSHGDIYFAIVTAQNAVGKTTSAVSNSIVVDITPPVAGRVVELSSEYIINVTSDRSTSELNSYSCNTVKDCNVIDAICQESLSSINCAWSAFTDPETDIVRYEVAVGTTPGGGEVRPFFITPVGKRYMTIENVALNGLQKVYVSVKATNGAGLSSISTSNGIYLSYASQGKPPLSHIGVWDGDYKSGDINYQTDRGTIKARWDVSGDPCPVSKYEWAIVRMDGLKVQDYIDSNGLTIVENDKLSMKNGERYYILLRVTNAMGYTYIIRSNGVTIQDELLVPGQVNDGDVIGFDLNKLFTKRKVSANWNGFGDIDRNTDQVIVESGNPGVQTGSDKQNQDIEYYEVALGKDRRFPKTRDNVVPFTNVGLNKTVTFYDLDLVVLTATYHFTVRAHSKSFSMAEVTSNGFQIGYDDGVEAGRIVMPKFVKSVTELEIQWDGFESKVGMFMYYVALSTNDTTNMECRPFIEGGSLSVEERVKILDLRDLENVGKDTYKHLTGLTLQQNNGYYVTVIGVDKAGECNMTSYNFHVDITPPIEGQIKVGPYYDMKMFLTSTTESLSVNWKDYADEESGIKCFRVSLIEEASCQEGATRTVIVQPIEINENYTSYKLLQLYLKASRPYIVKLEVENRAGLVFEAETHPIIYDVSTPTAGHVVDGLDYKQDMVWSQSVSTVTGTILYLPTNIGLPCPTRDIAFTEPSWKRFVSKKNYDSSGERLQLQYRDANVLLDESNDYKLEIKLARDVKTETMFSGGYYRDADMVNGGKYELNIQSADGNGKAVTSVIFWDGPETELIDYDYTKEVDRTSEVCACCYVNKYDQACLKTCDCKEYLKPTIIVKRSTTDNKPSYVHDLTEAERADALNKTVDTPTLQKYYRSCGIQILAGEAQKVITWCQFENHLYQPMKAERKLTFDPSKSINNYRLEFSVLHEEATDETWCFTVYVNDEEISELCGIPELSTESKLFLHVWNWKNYLQPIAEKIHEKFIDLSTKAIFQNMIMPPPKDDLCRFGKPFRGGTNGIVKFEAGVGRTRNSDSVVAFNQVLSPCLPCVTPCDRYSCDPNCSDSTITKFDIILDNLDLKPTEIDNGTIQPISYYLSVKAMLGSGEEVISSSDGFYIDVTKPVFNTEALLYIDVSQGNFTPVEFQGSNSTIRVIYLCQDNESLIVEYQWGIGSSPGQLDIQEFVSTGINPSGTNSTLGVLKNNATYYVSVKCINGAGLETLYKDARGVTVLLYAPNIDDVGTDITGVVEFDRPVSPATAKKSVDDHSIGCSWTVSADPTIREYDFGVGSSQFECDDIFPYTWVGYNVSGTVAIKDGWLQVDDVKISPIGSLNPTYTNASADHGPTGFKMEPGRTLYLCMKMCNKARKCTVRNIGSSVIVDSNSKMATSTNGEAIKLSYGSVSGRKKRDVLDVTVETPSGLDPGQSILMTPLTAEQMKTDYRSDASTEFVTFITNPTTTINDNTYLHRLLLNRLTLMPTDKSFAITSIGHHAIPGPLIITINYNPATLDGDKLPMVIHWNPTNQKWELSKNTCQNESNTEVIDTKSGEIRTKVCNTWRQSKIGLSRKRRAIQSDIYFNEDTQFMVTDVLKAIPNTPPTLISDTSLTMNEDGGTIVYQLKITDKEGDDATYKMGAITSEELSAEVNLTAEGLLVFLPCNDCYGNIEIPIEITEVQTGYFPPAVTNTAINITVLPVNDAPTVFNLEHNISLLHSDPTEPIVVLLDQNRVGQNDSNIFSWTFGAYDVDFSDKLRLYIDKPKNGSFKIGPAFDSTPTCGSEAMESMLPCKVMSLPHPAANLQWLYYSLTYQPEDGASGYDDIRLLILDNDGLSSDVVTLKIAVMIMPCINGGTCEPKNVDATYTCQDSRRAESFDDYYKCSCHNGWTGSRCHEDFDECLSSPCLWPYVCYNYENRYTCACPLDEPNCDAMVGWMIALIVIAVIFVIVLAVLVAYCCRVLKCRVKLSNLLSKSGSDNASDVGQTFENPAYDVDDSLPDNDVPATTHQFGPSIFDMVPTHTQSNSSSNDDSDPHSSSQQFGQSTFDMTRKSPIYGKLGLKATLGCPPNDNIYKTDFSKYRN